MASEQIRELRRVLRYRNHVVQMATATKNKISGLLMEVGAQYSKKQLHGRRYFNDLLESIEDVPPSVIELLNFSRSGLDLFAAVQKKLLTALKDKELIRDRVKRLMTIPGVGKSQRSPGYWKSAPPIGFQLARPSATVGFAAHKRSRPGKRPGDPFLRSVTSISRAC
jgi:transposase